MAAESKEDQKKPEPPARPPAKPGEYQLPPAGEVVVPHQEQAARPPAGKTVHRRRPLPLVPEAKPRPEDESGEKQED
jgi:hypothetical protein